MGARKESLIPSLEVVHTWGGTPQREELFDGSAPVTIGEDAASTFLLPREALSGLAQLVLALPGEDSWTVRVPTGADARADVQGRDVDLTTLPADADGARLLRLPLGARVEIVLGAHSFFARPTEREQAPALAPMDVARYRFLLPSVVLHALFLLGVFLAPPSAGALVVDIDQQDQRYLRFHTDASEALPEPAIEPTPSDSGSSEGRSAQGAEGVAGRTDETRHTGGQVHVRGTGDDRRVPLTQTAAAHAGILGALATIRFDSAVRSPFGAATAIGFSEDDAYGSLEYLTAGNSPGAGGLGIIGHGHGGCPPGATCTGEGTVGVGNLDVIGGNGNSCSPTEFASLERTLGHAAAVDHCTGRWGTGVIGNGNHHARVPNPVTPGTATLAGGLSREDVRRVITRNLPQVRNCYQQGLLGNPDLAGRVTVSFIITPTGSVHSSVLDAQHSDLPDSSVSSCVTTAVSHWSFPSADSMTMVSYPFRLDTTP